MQVGIFKRNNDPNACQLRRVKHIKKGSRLVYKHCLFLRFKFSFQSLDRYAPYIAVITVAGGCSIAVLGVGGAHLDVPGLF